jgi:hypothetical protein
MKTNEISERLRNLVTFSQALQQRRVCDMHAKIVCVRKKTDSVVQLICNYEWQTPYEDCFDVTRKKKLHLRWINYCGNGFSCLLSGYCAIFHLPSELKTNETLNEQNILRSFFLFPKNCKSCTHVIHKKNKRELNQINMGSQVQ